MPERPMSGMPDKTITVDDQAEVDGAEAHQVARQPEETHARERHQHGERDRDRDDEAGAQVAEQEEEHHDDQHRTLQQVVLDRADRALHQGRAVVVGYDLDAGRQLWAQVPDGGLDPLHDGARVLALLHHGDADDGLASRVVAHRAEADLRRLHHLAQGADGDGQATRVRGHHDVGDVRGSLRQAEAADHLLLVVVLDVGAATSHVVLGERRVDLAECHPVAMQRLGGDPGLVGRQLAAVDVHVRDAGRQLQPWCDSPLQDALQLHRRIGRPAQLELVDLAQPGRHRPHLRVADAGRHHRLSLGQALEDLGPRLRDGHAVLEGDVDRRDAEAGDRADAGEARSARHRALHGEADEALHLLRAEAGRERQDHHLLGRDVGHRVDG